MNSFRVPRTESFPYIPIRVHRSKCVTGVPSKRRRSTCNRARKPLSDAARVLGGFAPAYEISSAAWHFDHWARIWDHHVVASGARPGERVLDLGCHTAYSPGGRPGRGPFGSGDRDRSITVISGLRSSTSPAELHVPPGARSISALRRCFARLVVLVCPPITSRLSIVLVRSAGPFGFCGRGAGRLSLATVRHPA